MTGFSDRQLTQNLKIGHQRVRLMVNNTLVFSRSSMLIRVESAGRRSHQHSLVQEHAAELGTPHRSMLGSSNITKSHCLPVISTISIVRILSIRQRSGFEWRLGGAVQFTQQTAVTVRPYPSQMRYSAASLITYVLHCTESFQMRCGATYQANYCGAIATGEWCENGEQKLWGKEHI